MLKLQYGNSVISVTHEMAVKEIVPKEERMDIYGAVLNGKLHDLNCRIKEEGTLQFIYADSDDGKLIYERSLRFLFIAAVKSLCEKARIHVRYSFSDGLYCEITDADRSLCRDEIYERMCRIVRRKETIDRQVVAKEAAVSFFEEIGMRDKADLLRYRTSDVCSIYRLCGFADYFYGIMLPDTSYITHFFLHSYKAGFWLSHQPVFIDQPHLFQTLQRVKQYWCQHGIETVAQLNKKILDGQMNAVVDLSEEMIQKEYEDLVHAIVQVKKDVRLILIAGPSSAGKTTFTRRLARELKKAGIATWPLSMDDYYKDRIDTPRFPDGTYDFENIASVDMQLFNEHMQALSEGACVRLPKFNFKTGKREWEPSFTHLEEGQILMVEGIHGLNPATSAAIADFRKFRIYINDLNTLNYDDHNRIPTSDYRLLRRIVRDHQFRDYSAAQTISGWKKVREGEIRYIYPYQEHADFIFHTSMIYELSILKKIAVPLLDKITPQQCEYPQANRLKKLLAYIAKGDECDIPDTSILREFIGNSIFFT